MPDLTKENWHHHWRSVVSTMSEGLFVVDTKGVVVYMNPAVERITGYSRDEVVGQRCTVLEADSCRICSVPGEPYFCELFKKGRVLDKRCIISAKDGRVVHLLKSARVLRDESGNDIGGVETITDISQLVDKDRQINGLRRQLSQNYGFGGLLGQSRAMRRVYELLEAAAPSLAPVVIFGESGTGKELAAASIHRHSARASQPFIKLNCAALNQSLLESELFGHQKGSFTGADRTRKGRFEAAHGGSIFLDEIGDLPPAVQVKLLRVLQEGEIERVGSQRPIKVDVRLITATNKDLAELVEKGSFRQDLYYRINVIPIELPPLRERMEDIPLLAQTFVERTALRSSRPITGFSPRAMAVLMKHNWPGNVRELINVVEFAFVTCPHGMIQPSHLPPNLLGRGMPAMGSGNGGEGRESGGDQQGMRQEIIKALEATGGRKGRAAELLGVSRVTLWKRMKRLDMDG